MPMGSKWFFPKRVIRALLLIAACALSTGAIAKTERSAADVLEFKRHNPCPSTGKRSGACPGYQVDHIEPLCAGGLDKRENMQWLSVQEHKWKTRTDVRVCRGLRKEGR